MYAVDEGTPIILWTKVSGKTVVEGGQGSVQSGARAFPEAADALVAEDGADSADEAVYGLSFEDAVLPDTDELLVGKLTGHGGHASDTGRTCGLAAGIWRRRGKELARDWGLGLEPCFDDIERRHCGKR
jgi:hypothetical protein